MTTQKKVWQGEAMWWISFGVMVSLIRRVLLYLVPIIPQRTELWLTTKWRVIDLSAYFNDWITIPGEILGAAAVVYVVMGLFNKENGEENAPRSPRIAISGIAVGSVFSIPLVLISPYDLAILVAFAAGFFAMMLVTMEISDHDNLYSGFGIVAGIAITTCIVCGGYLAAIATVFLAVANLAGIFCGLIVGGMMRYVRKRWFL